MCSVNVPILADFAATFMSSTCVYRIYVLGISMTKLHTMVYKVHNDCLENMLFMRYVIYTIDMKHYDNHDRPKWLGFFYYSIVVWGVL